MTATQTGGKEVFMTVSKAQQKAVAKYMKNNYDEIKIRVEKRSIVHLDGYISSEYLFSK